MELKKIGKIWRNCKTLIEAKPSFKHMGCWQKCYQCEKPWKELETEFVHMTINEEGDTRYLCDKCLVLHSK